MIKSLSVYGLHNRFDHEITLHPDINIFTGRNGSGKTTLLKLLWYMISPNVERVLREITFREAQVITDEFKLHISCENLEKSQRAKFRYTGIDNIPLEINVEADNLQGLPPTDDIEDINRKIMVLPSGSVFFPTFRRIEGGFSIGRKRRSASYAQQMADNVSEVISRYAGSISVSQHRFIASISTEDVEQLLTQQYADVSEQTNGLHLELSAYISEQVSAYDHTNIPQVDPHDNKRAIAVLSAIKSKLASVDKRRTVLMSPFNVLSSLITNIFKDKGIKVSNNLTFGETKEAISANILSAGEKQMLSFLCYNAFVEKSPIFIDEPELSLHGDWQRILFSTLLSQGTANQFIVSTHSPFIYSKFPEKEIPLDPDRGA